MKSGLLILLIITCISIFTAQVFSILTYELTIRSSGVIATISPLHVEGRYIKNAFGQTVFLRGVNKEGFEDEPSGWWNPAGGGYTSGYAVWNPDAVAANLDAMKSWGINVIRSHQIIRYWLDNENKTYDGRYVGINYRDAIKEVIRMCGERGIYYIFDPYGIRGYGEPYGGGEQDRLPFPPYSKEYEYGAPTLIIPDEDAFVDYWRSVAKELKDYPNVIFDLWNEPTWYWAEREKAMEDWHRVWQKCIDAIRSVGATQLIIIQWDTSLYCNLNYPETSRAPMDWVENYPFNDTLGNLVYSFHTYRGDFHYTDPTWVNVWNYTDIKRALQYCLVDYVLFNLSKPVICAEIGANMWQTGEELERELAYLNNSLTIFNEWEMGYIVFVWTIPSHMQNGILQPTIWIPPPNEAGQILINAIARGK
jgi:hypothetical protein